MNRQPTDTEVDYNIQLRDSELKGYVYLIFPFSFKKMGKVWASGQRYMNGEYEYCVPVSIIKDFKSSDFRASDVWTTMLVPQWYYDKNKESLNRFRKQF